MEALATITSVKGLVQALQAIKTSNKLPCAVQFDASGLTLRFLDGGHAMQSGIYLSTAVSADGRRATRCLLPLLRAVAHLACFEPSLTRPLQVFSHYQAPTASLTFLVPLSVLLDSVATVASSMPQELHLQYPGPANSFLITWVLAGWRAGRPCSAALRRPTHPCSAAATVLLRPCNPCMLPTHPSSPPHPPTPTPATRHPPHCSATEDTSGRTSICSYAKIATLAQQELSSLEDVWDPADASSHAILSGACSGPTPCDPPAFSAALCLKGQEQLCP